MEEITIEELKSDILRHIDNLRKSKNIKIVSNIGANVAVLVDYRSFMLLQAKADLSAVTKKLYKAYKKKQIVISLEIRDNSNS